MAKRETLPKNCKLQIYDQPDAIHSSFIEIATCISVPLTVALHAVGPVTFPEREDRGIGHHLARSVIGQQLSTKAARAIWARVEAAALRARVPIPEFFDLKCEERLRECGVSRNKIKALRSLHDAHREGLLSSDTLRRLDHATRSQKLVSIWGIGQWTCDMASIFYCRCPDVWPESDVAVQKTFAGLIGLRNPKKTASHFTPYRSYLALTMWQFLDQRPQD